MRHIYLNIIFLLIFLALKKLNALEIVENPYEHLNYEQINVYTYGDGEEEDENPCSYRLYPDF